MVKYTFLVPSYKGFFLKDALESMLHQSYDNFNILVSDDCSPNNIEEIVNTFSDERLIYRRNNQNIGGINLVNHWNLLLNLCDSDYLIMASDDDIYNSHFLEYIDKLITKYPQTNVIRARTQRIDSDGNVIAMEDIYDEFQSEIEAIRGLLCGNTIGCIGNYVFKTETLKLMGGFVNFPYAWFSDIATVIAMIKHGQVNTSKTLFSFRLSGQNISSYKGHKKIEIEKLKATLAFDQWMSSHLHNITFENTKLYQNMFLEITKAYKHRVYTQVGDYSWAVSVWNYIKIYNKLKCVDFFSKSSFLKYFGIAILNRKFSCLA